jgi:hypothetical protein
MADPDLLAAKLEDVRALLSVRDDLAGAVNAAPFSVADLKVVAELNAAQDEVAGCVPRLLAVADAALKHHRREPLYGNAATEGEPDACPHDPDSSLHFEAGDGGEWLCEGKPEGAVCESCTDGEGGERVDWPCQEYRDIKAALLGEAGNADPE